MSSPSEKECYALIQQIAILQDPVCTKLGCWHPSDCGHHLFKRDRLATAFLPHLVRGLCDHHHKWAHRKPKEYEDEVRAMAGDEAYDSWLRLSHTVVPDFDFKAKKKELKILLDKLS